MISKCLTGEVLYDLPSPYVPHRCGLLHLPRFIAKIRKYLAGELPESYHRNFTKGFDGFLCLHLEIEAEQIIDIVKIAESEADLDARLEAIFPKDLKVHEWNRKMVQMGISEMGQASLKRTKAKMGLSHRADLISYADMIDVDEGKIN